MTSFQKYLCTTCLLFLATSPSAISASNQHQCRSGQVSVQSLTKPPTSNGCSKLSGPAVRGEEDITYCCDLHDVCYSTCGASKSHCEEDFGKCIKELCRSQFSHNPQCSRAASMYYMGTTMFGGGGFDDLQADNCQCIDESEVSNHYDTVFRRIYEKHTNKSEQEISELLSKFREKTTSQIDESEVSNQYDTEFRRIYEKHTKKSEQEISDLLSKFREKLTPQSWLVQQQVKWYASMYYRIIKKYDTAIEHEGQRVGKNPPKPRVER